MSPKVSIIVPVYNAQKTLSRCIDSILKQDYADFELILVDDGSLDESGIICDEYAKNDARIKVIHKENSGVSDSRNRAIDYASGEYLQFLDSDDWITPDATRLFVEAAELNQCDMVISDFYRVIGERLSHKGSIDEEGVLTRVEFANFMMESPADFYYGVLWNKLYRREIVEKYHLRMDSKISWCEDFMFNLEYIRYCEHIFVLQVPIYYYVKTKGSLVSQGMSITKTIKTKMMVLEYYTDFYRQVLTEEEYEKKRIQIYKYLVDIASDERVLPTILSNSQKVGEERSRTNVTLASGDTYCEEEYRQRKLLDYYLEPIAIKTGLSLEEIHILLALSYMPVIKDRKELADFLGITEQRQAYLFSRFYRNGYFRISKIRGKEQLKIFFFSSEKKLLEEIQQAEAEYKKVRFAGFSEQDMEEYNRLSDMIKENTARIIFK